MEILFTKNISGDHILSCKRKNGSVSWKHVSSFFIIHDLCHFAVETLMPLKKAFYGMVAAGTDISDFDLPKDQRKFELTEEALFAEQLVNMLTIEYSQGRMENFIEIFTSINDAGSNKALPIDDILLEKTRNLFNQLIQKWNSLKDSETMTLSFE